MGLGCKFTSSLVVDHWIAESATIDEGRHAVAGEHA